MLTSWLVFEQAYFEAARAGESLFSPILDTGESYRALERKMWLATKVVGSIVGFGKKQVFFAEQSSNVTPLAAASLPPLTLAF